MKNKFNIPLIINNSYLNGGNHIEHYKYNIIYRKTTKRRVLSEDEDEIKLFGIELIIETNENSKFKKD